LISYFRQTDKDLRVLSVSVDLNALRYRNTSRSNHVSILSTIGMLISNVMPQLLGLKDSSTFGKGWIRAPKDM
jgi:hypothetical protein